MNIFNIYVELNQEFLDPQPWFSGLYFKIRSLDPHRLDIQDILSLDPQPWFIGLIFQICSRTTNA